MRTAIIHRAPQIESRVAATIGRQTAVVHRAPQNEVEARSEAPIGQWTKVIGFTIGLAIAIGGYALMVRFQAWRSSASSHPTHTVSASAAVETSEHAVSTSAPVAEPPFVKKAKAHKASHAKRRHAAKHRVASRH